MDIFDKNSIKELSDIVFESDQIEQRIERLLTQGGATSTLFYGGAGTGKSSLCRVIAKQLVGKGFEPDVKVINVSEFATRAKLCKKIGATGGFALSNKLGKMVIILEELDGADITSQNALKAVLDKESRDKLFFATTNNLSNIIEPIRSRFLEIPINMPKPDRWLSRALSVLKNEDVIIDEEQCLEFLTIHAKGKNGRGIMRALDDYAWNYHNAP